MQTRRGFVEDVQRFAPLRALQFGGQLDALSLAAGKLRGRLSQPDISQADLPEDAQRPAKGGVVGKEIKRAVYRHREDVGNRLIPDLDFQRLGVVARTLAGRTGRVDARQKKQFHAHEPLPLASLAPALRNIERETARIVPPGAGLFGGRKQFTDMIEETGIRRQIRPRRPADRLLVYHDQPLDTVQAFENLAA